MLPEVRNSTFTKFSHKVWLVVMFPSSLFSSDKHTTLHFPSFFLLLFTFKLFSVFFSLKSWNRFSLKLKNVTLRILFGEIIFTSQLTVCSLSHFTLSHRYCQKCVIVDFTGSYFGMFRYDFCTTTVDLHDGTRCGWHNMWDANKMPPYLEHFHNYRPEFKSQFGANYDVEIVPHWQIVEKRTLSTSIEGKYMCCLHLLGSYVLH